MFAWAAVSRLALKLLIVGPIFVLIQLCAQIRRYKLGQRGLYVFVGRVARAHESKSAANASVYRVNDAVSTPHNVGKHFEFKVS